MDSDGHSPAFFSTAGVVVARSERFSFLATPQSAEPGASRQAAFVETARCIALACREAIGAQRIYIDAPDWDGAMWQSDLVDGDLGPRPLGEPCRRILRRFARAQCQDGRAAYDNHPAASAWAREFAESALGLENTLCVPLTPTGGMPGLLGLLDKPGGFGNADARAAEGIAALAALALENLRTREMLDAGRDCLHALLLPTRDALVMADHSGRIVLANGQAETMFGYPPGGLIGTTVTSLMPERYRQAHQGALHSAASQNAATPRRGAAPGFPAELTGLRCDGAEFPIEVSLGRWTSAEGICHTAILRDVTQHKQEEALRARLADDLQQRVNALNCLLGLSRLVECARSIEDIFRGAVELLSRALRHPEYTPARIVLDDLEYATHGYRAGEATHSAPIRVHGREVGSVEVDGPGVAVAPDATPDAPREQVLLTAMAERLGRIVERWQAMEELRETKCAVEARLAERSQQLTASELRLAEAQRIGHLGDWEWVPVDGRMTWSDEVYRIFGLEPGQHAAGMEEFLRAVHPSDRDHVRAVLDHAQTQDTASYYLEHRIATPARRTRTVYQRIQALPSAAGAPARIVGTVVDLTERRELERRVFTAASEEQRRIGQDLHDGLGQELTALGYVAKRLSQRLKSQKLPEAEEAAALADGIPAATALLRSIVHGVLPLEVGADDLAPALQVLVENAGERTGMKCVFHGDAEAVVSDDAHAIQLFRIAQEAVNNAVRHSRAQTVTVALRRRDGRLTLEIDDDGIGISLQAERPKGMGLHIMRYRAEAIGATLAVGARPGGGTQILCTLSGR